MAAALLAKVSFSTLSLSVASPGFSTAQSVSVTVRVPPGALSSVVHASTGNVFVSAPLAPDFSLQASGTGWLHVAAAPVAPGGSVSVTLVRPR